MYLRILLRSLPLEPGKEVREDMIICGGMLQMQRECCKSLLCVECTCRVEGRSAIDNNTCIDVPSCDCHLSPCLSSLPSI